MTDLDGKVALVTGGSRGIGAAVARELAGRGADVAISYAASADRAAAVVADLVGRGVRGRAFASDQADGAAPAALIDAVVAAFGGIDILVANAGRFAIGAIDSGDTAALDAMYAVNVAGTIAMLRAAARAIREDGRIIVVSSALADRVGGPALADYASSKAAVEGYVKGAAHDLAARRVTINAIRAGATDTEMNPADGPISDWLKSLVALGRYARPEEIAAVIGFLASPRASYVTGALIPVDGGGGA